MSNTYKQAVNMRDIVKYKSLKGLAVMAFFIAIVFILISQNVPAAIMVITGISALYYRRYCMFEYYYEISNGEVIISKVMVEKKADKPKKEKQLLSFRISDIIIMGPQKNEKLRSQLKDLNRKKDKTFRFCQKGLVTGVYTAFVKSGEKVIKLELLPDKTFVDICKKENKANVIKEL
ncbi:MAG: hypothetical protein AB9844_06210 [Clostridiaceae bacterium]